MTLRRTLVLSFLVVVTIPAIALAANTFGDDNGSVHERSIEAIAQADITEGCNPPENDEFCPDRDVTRSEMAAFLVRALDLPNTETDHFDDDNGSTFERAINRLAEAGITKGCNPPHNDEFCPDESVTRGQMAAFLARALSLSNASGDTFNDDDGSIFENNIEKIAAVGITKGCNPPENDEFCPDESVTRGQMATFLTRALDLEIPSTDDHPNDDTPDDDTSDDDTSDDDTSDIAVDGEITGEACPCTVTGTVELKGNVSLQGDLMVEGGTLVARPGVNVNGNGFQIMFMDGGKADFQGSKVFTWSDRGAKQNLERDVVFRNMKRIMWMNGGGKSVLKYIRVDDSGTSTLGDYPLHWHLNGSSTRGTIVEGVVVVNGKNHAYVPHGSHGITFKDVIAKNTVEDAFWWDPPGSNESCEFNKFCTLDNSNDIIVEHALVDGVKPEQGSKGFKLTGFMLGAGSGNSIRDSVAINVNATSIKDCSGFQWPSKANGNEGGNVWVFVNNYSLNSSGCHGIFVWQNDTRDGHVVENFSGGGIQHGAYKNFYDYINIDVPYFNVKAAGVKFEGGRIDIAYMRGHKSDFTPSAEFTGTSIGRFVVANGSGEDPGHYVLNDTGLTCDDIEYETVLAGTTVIIDGTECGT